MKPISVPNELLETLVCVVCQKYLSVGPIHTRQDGCAAVCGRCIVPDAAIYTNDEAFQYIIQYFAFPCCHAKNGCSSKFTPIDMRVHEDDCDFRALKCPSRHDLGCDWVGQLSEFRDHYSQSHPEFLMDPAGTFELSFMENISDRLCFPSDGESFIVERTFNIADKYFFCNVSSPKSGTFRKYMLVLTSQDGEYEYKFPICSVNDFVCAHITFLTGELFSLTIFGKIEIFNLTENELHEKRLAINDNSDINWELLKELTCSYCLTFVLPPISKCRNDHIFCYRCRSDNAKCKLCMGALKINTSLMRLVQNIIYPCKYYKVGCNHFGGPSEMKLHQFSCDYGPQECPLNNITSCKWIFEDIQRVQTEGLPNVWTLIIPQVLQHIQGRHAGKILRDGTVHVTSRFLSVDVYYNVFLIIFQGRVFKVNYKFESQVFYWITQLVGTSSDCRKYNVEINIDDSSQNNLSFYRRGLCGTIKNKTSFYDRHYCIVINYEDIKALILKSFKYTIRIINVDDEKFIH